MSYPDLDGLVIAFDTETTGLTITDRVFGFSVAADGWSGYFDIREYPQAVRWVSEMRPARIVAHNASFDYRMATRTGFTLDLSLFDDTVIRASLIDEHLPAYSLDALGERYLGERKQAEIYPQLAALFGGRATRNVQMPNIHRAPSSIVAPYAIRDAELTLALWKWQEAEIERQGIEDIVTFERRLMPTLIRAEMRGIRVDLERADAAFRALDIQAREEQRGLDKLLGRAVNVNSTPQVRALFNPERRGGVWVTDTGHTLESTDAGAPSIDAEALRSMDADPRAQGILKVRSLIKTRDTFIAGHIIGSEFGGRVYPTINQCKGESAGTGTGRLSYTAPAMQQIPSRNKSVAAIVKPIFLPDRDQLWVDGDMQSFEVRVFAHLVNDPNICAQYAANPLSDFHQMVADMTGLPRNATYSGEPNAKQLNLSMIFNSGNGAIADKMGMGWDWNTFDAGGERVTYKKARAAAMEVIDDYHRKLPGVKKLADGAAQVARDRGYVRTRYGRRMRFPQKRFVYKASGLLIQSTAADINKMNWMIIDEAAREVGGNIILNTHDSYSLSLPDAGAWREIKRRVETAYPWFRVPLILELSGTGPDWWSAVK
jgi:DNA polymerase I-like protein with 3'-5' exonuclease and polymerase domains